MNLEFENINLKDISGFSDYFEESKNNDFSLSSIYSKSEYYLCKKCLLFPKIKFLKNKIKLICPLEPTTNKGTHFHINNLIMYLLNPTTTNSKYFLNPHFDDKSFNIVIPFQESKDKIVYDNNEYENYFNLNCKVHNNNFTHYCFKCKKYLCLNCLENCNNHKKYVKDFNIDYLKAKEKIKKIEELDIYKYLTETTIEIYYNNNIDLSGDVEIINLIEDSNDNHILHKIYMNKNTIINCDNKDFAYIPSILDKLNDADYSKIKLYFNLFKIIFDNFRKFPNYTHIINIKNIEKYINNVLKIHY